MNIQNDIINAFLPELIIIIFIIINIISALFFNRNTYKPAKITVFTALLLSAISLCVIQKESGYYAFNNTFVSNIYTCIFKIMIIISALLTIACSNNLIREKRNKSFEYFSIFLSGILGAFCLVSSNNFLSAFISLELLSISCYLLCGFRKNHKSKEASLKYLLTGAAASAIILLGVSYLYGISGSIDFLNIYESYSIYGINLLYVYACMIILAGILFKLGCIPFSNWVPDVYEGSNYSVCLYLSLIPKIAAAAFITRIFVYIFSFSPIIKITAAILAVITIIYSSIGGIKQTNIKRLYAYSSIIHSGFILLAISNLNLYSISAVIFYLITYIFMNTGIWSASIIYSTELQSDNIEDYKGLFIKHPYFSIAAITCLLSLAGLPVTSGFTAKLYLFSAISRGNLLWLIILFIAMLASVIAVFVYFKIIKELFSKLVNNITIYQQNKFSKFILYLCAGITILICICPDFFIKLSQISAYYI